MSTVIAFRFRVNIVIVYVIRVIGGCSVDHVMELFDCDLIEIGCRWWCWISNGDVVGYWIGRGWVCGRDLCWVGVVMVGLDLIGVCVLCGYMLVDEVWVVWRVVIVYRRW